MGASLAACWNCMAETTPQDFSCAGCGEVLRIGDAYSIEQRIGEGCLGIVYRAKLEARAERIAVKLFHGKQPSAAAADVQASEAYQAVLALDHPNMASILAIGVHQEQLYVAQQLIDGEPLGRIFDDHPSGAPVGEACHIAERLLEALVYVHARGMLHGNIDPSHVLFTTQRGVREPVLLDCGLDRLRAGPATRWRGTPGYAAPEQILAPQVHDERSDVYAVGALLYALLLGGRVAYHRVLYDGIAAESHAVREAYDQIARGDIPLEDVTIRRRQVTPELAAVIRRALDRDPASRYPSAKEMLVALRAAAENIVRIQLSQDGHTDDAIDVSKLEQDETLAARRKLAERNRWMTRVGTATGLVMLAVGVYLASQRTDDRNAAAAARRASTMALLSATATARAATPRSTSFSFPAGIALDGGKIYVADRGAHRIRLAENARVTTLAGTGRAGFANGPLDAAIFNAPTDVAVGRDGVIYVADSGNHQIRRIADGVVSTFAGAAEAGRADGVGTMARFRMPTAVSVGPDGMLYVADAGNHAIRRVDLATTEVTTFAGQTAAGSQDGPIAQAELSTPSSLAVDAHGKVYFTEAASGRLRIIEDGHVRTVASLSLDDAAAGAEAGHDEKRRQLAAAPRVAIGAKGRVLVTAPQLHAILELKEDQLLPFAGDAKHPGYRDTFAPQARFLAPHGIAISDNGTIFVTDNDDHRLRAIRDGVVTTVAR
jgi:serine/threonine protein kinase/streptogramin lyase